MKINILKTVTGFVTSAAVGTVVRNVVKNNIVASGGPVNMVLVGIGSYIIGGMISQHAVEYVNGQIDETVVWVNEVLNQDKK